MCTLTFDHDHVDIDGADRRLRQPLPFLQDVWDFPRRDAIIRFASEGHQLPDGHSWGKGKTEGVEKEGDQGKQGYLP